ncbi:hypothetical protein [Microbacterium sp. JZ31]|uniref:hypothetical protein n=1 Tax=Microbacterium sp. JZ31 TaxID=1906274 RepID=UPI0019319369|nr:hypothetical protein [Microbacterium sp. JZ31]
MSRNRTTRAQLPPQERAERLKERIYLTFTALAVVITLDSHGHPTPGEAMATLAVTSAATLLAVFVADLVSHLVVHGEIHTRAELRRAAAVSLGAIGAVALPFVFLALAVFDVWTLSHALRGAKAALIVALVAIGWLAVRRTRASWWQKLFVLGAEAGLGLAVIGLELLAHG